MRLKLVPHGNDASGEVDIEISWGMGCATFRLAGREPSG
jgi:hypothetical protein